MHSKINRRQALKLIGAATALACLPETLVAKKTSGPAGDVQGGTSGKRPNILYIFTDQQQAGMLSCTGNPRLHTPPKGLTGRSVRELAEGRGPTSWRKSLVVEDHFGRSLRKGKIKYNIYDTGKNREQLIDLERDPGELKNFAVHPDYQNTLRQYRQLLAESVHAVDDQVSQPYLVG